MTILPQNLAVNKIDMALRFTDSNSKLQLRSKITRLFDDRSFIDFQIPMNEH